MRPQSLPPKWIAVFNSTNLDNGNHIGGDLSARCAEQTRYWSATALRANETSPNNMNLLCFPLALVRRLLASPFHSRLEPSGLPESSSSSHMHCTCN